MIRIAKSEELFTEEQFQQLYKLEEQIQPLEESLRKLSTDPQYRTVTGKMDAEGFTIYAETWTKIDKLKRAYRDIIDEGWTVYANKFWSNEEDALKDVEKILSATILTKRVINKDTPDEHFILTMEANLKNQYYAFVISTIVTEQEIAFFKDPHQQAVTVQDNFIDFLQESLDPIYKACADRDLSTRLLDQAIQKKVNYYFNEEGNYIPERLDTPVEQLTLDIFPEETSTTELTVPEDIPSLTWNRPSNYIQTIDKASTKLTAFETGTRYELGRGYTKNSEVITYVTIANTIGKIDDFDRSVFWALCTEWEAGNRVTTAEKIQQILAKNFNIRLLASQEEQCLKILDSCKRLNQAQITLDATQEYDNYNYPKLKEGAKTGSIASIVVDTAILNGHLIDNAIHILDLSKSPLYWYAKGTGEITSTPFSLLEDPVTNGKRPYKKINTTPETIRLQEIIIYRINAIANGMSNIVKLDYILEKLGLDEEEYKDYRQKVKAVRGNVESLLNKYTKTGYLRRWERSYRGKTIVGYKLYPPKKKK